MAVAEAREEITDAPGVEVTLEGVLEHLVGVLDVICAPKGLAVPVRSATIHDVVEPDRVEAHDLVLAVGVRPNQAALADLLRAAGNAGASGVVVKSAEALSNELVDAAGAAGVALMCVPPEMAWAQLHSLLRVAFASSGINPVAAEGAPIGDLFALANAVAAMVGGPVTIEDTRSRILAYSSTGAELDEPRRQAILGRRVPDEWVELLTQTGAFKKLWSTSDVVRIDDLTGDGTVRPRLAIAVRAGDELLGSIWVAEGDAPFAEQADEALRDAAAMAALHIVRSRAGEDLERRVRGEQLRTILEGRGPLEVLATRLNADPTGRYAVVAYELRPGVDAAVVAQRERALDFVAMFCEAYRRKAASVAIGQTIYTLVPLDGPDTAALFRHARELIERAEESLKIELRAGVGSVAEGLREVTRSRADADQVLRVLERTSSPARVAGIDDVRSEAMLLELGDLVQERPHLLIGEIDRVVAHDEKHGSDYVQTLLAYFDAFGDVPMAARRLDVHPNTLRYRLRRIAEFAGIDLTDPQQRLAAELQLRLR
jgi:DNA-binding PucR family transcriptional regulator